MTTLNLNTLKGTRAIHLLKVLGAENDIIRGQENLVEASGFSDINHKNYHGEFEYGVLKALPAPLSDIEKALIVTAMAKELLQVVQCYVSVLAKGVEKFDLPSEVLMERVVKPALSMVAKHAHWADMQQIYNWGCWACSFMLVDAGWQVQEDPVRLEEIKKEGSEETEIKFSTTPWDNLIVHLKMDVVKNEDVSQIAPVPIDPAKLASAA